MCVCACVRVCVCVCACSCSQKDREYALLIITNQSINRKSVSHDKTNPKS